MHHRATAMRGQADIHRPSPAAALEDDSDTEEALGALLAGGSPVPGGGQESAHANIAKLVKLMRRSVRLMERTRVRHRTHEDMNHQWKEVATRLDLALFVINCTIVVFTPVGLFGKYFVRHDLLATLNNTCGCG